MSSHLFRCMRNATVHSPFFGSELGLCIIAHVSLFIGASATCRIAQATYRVSARGQACVPAGTFLDGTRLEANKRSELIPGKSEFNLGPCRWKFTLASMAYPPARTDNTEPADRGGSSLTSASDLFCGKFMAASSHAYAQVPTATLTKADWVRAVGGILLVWPCSLY